MKRLHLWFIFGLLICVTGFKPAFAVGLPSTRDGTPFCGGSTWRPNNLRYARTLENLNVGQPREVRLVYFLPKGRESRPEVMQRMKDEIRRLQTFFAEQMGAHGHGNQSFRVETDAEGEPIVHRADGEHPNSHYISSRDNAGGVFTEVDLKFDTHRNVYFIVIDNSIEDLDGKGTAGLGSRHSKNGGAALVTDEFLWHVVAHELGHAFGLMHDFHDGTYIMSYGPGEERLSSCSAHFLTSHPCLNANVPIAIDEETLPTIELVSARHYPAGSKSIPLQFKIADSDGILQTVLFVNTVKPHFAAGFPEVKMCGLRHDDDFIFTLDYDGVVPSDGLTSLSNPTAHPITLTAVDARGNFHTETFYLAEISQDHVASLKGHTEWVSSVSFSPDGQTLASVSVDGEDNGAVTLWDVAAQKSITTLEANSVSFSPDGERLALGSLDGTIMLWNMATRERIGTLWHENWVEYVSFSPVAETLASVSVEGEENGTVTLWNVATQEPIGTLRHENWVYSVSFSPDGEMLASVSVEGEENGTVTLWNVATQESIGTLRHEWVNSVSFSPDGETLASGAFDGMITLWNVATQESVGTLRHEWVYSVSFSPDGETLASGSSDETVKLWDVETKLNFATLTHVSPVSSVSFSRDGTRLASGTDAGTVELWDTSRWLRLRLDATAEIEIPDPNLRAAIVKKIGLSPSDPIRQNHLDDLISLEAKNANISDLTGIEHATNLKTLDLGEEYVEEEEYVEGQEGVANSNSISDFSPLMDLANLRQLNLSRSNISDISPVKGLTNLTELFLGANAISDISPVEGLTKLTYLDLTGSNISDISPVKGLTNLTELFLGANAISDISPVEGLTKLTYLDLTGSNISDISPVEGLTKLTGLDLSENGIEDISTLAGLTKLTVLFLGANAISDISPVEGLTKLTYLDLSGNVIEDISPLVSNLGLGEGDDVDLEGNPLSDLSIKTHIPALKSRGVAVHFDTAAAPSMVSYEIPTKTKLLANYPNPFNPETWIPYHLAAAAEVTLTIYDTQGREVRRLDVGHQNAGYYTKRTTAAYWDGRNAVGATVASGVYFYHLSAGDFSETRRLVILK